MRKRKFVELSLFTVTWLPPLLRTATVTFHAAVWLVVTVARDGVTEVISKTAWLCTLIEPLTPVEATRRSLLVSMPRKLRLMGSTPICEPV